MRNISISYSLISAVILFVAPQSVTIGTSVIRIPNGIFAQSESNFLVEFLKFAF